VFVEAKDDGDGCDNWTTRAISRAKLQSNHHHQWTNIQFFLQAGCPSCHPTNSVKALKGKYHIPWTCLPQAHLGVFQLCLWPLIAPGYLGEGCHASHQPSNASTPCCTIICYIQKKKHKKLTKLRKPKQNKSTHPTTHIQSSATTHKFHYQIICRNWVENYSHNSTNFLLTTWMSPICHRG